jgi:L,D-peptidoglycan transpeptidase YkuD (ErfK/YbiS/YcfS/YnhG family)
VRSENSRLESMWAAQVQAARDEVLRARDEVRDAGMGRREAAACQRASYRLQVAEKLAAAGRHRATVVELEEARSAAALVHHTWKLGHVRFSDAGLIAQWRHWAQATIEDSRSSGSAAILIDKLRRRVFVYNAGKVLGSFAAELGANGLRRKEHAGDRATPEGRYRVTQMKDSRSTRYFKALLINYPNDEDRMLFSLGKRRGTIPTRAGIGSLIEIHGEGGQGQDWTDGCVALRNEDMEKVFAWSRIGMPVTIVGTYER